MHTELATGIVPEKAIERLMQRFFSFPTSGSPLSNAKDPFSDDERSSPPTI